MKLTRSGGLAGISMVASVDLDELPPATARKVKAAQEQAIERQERVLTKQALDAEAEALDATKQALDAQETVEVIDDTIEGSAEARSSA